MREAAFTTTELMITMAVMGILAAVTAPNLGVQLSTIRLNSATNEIASELQRARVRAIAQNSGFGLRFDLVKNTYQVQKEGEDRNNNGVLDPGEDLNGNGLLDRQGMWQDVGGTRPLPRGINLVSVSAGRNPLSFQSLGVAPGGNAIITLQNGRGRTNIIRVSTAGRILVEKDT